jgi:hypothetical protein
MNTDERRNQMTNPEHRDHRTAREKLDELEANGGRPSGPVVA